MPTLRRSHSTAAREAKEQDRKKIEAASARGRPSLQAGERKRAVKIPERPKTADDRHRSFSRPRTAHSGAERNMEQELPPEIIEFRSGADTYNFPTPSPRVPPKSATFHHSPSPSPLAFRESPGIGMALGSPTQAAMPTWGRSQTADQLGSRRKAPSPIDHPSPALPERTTSRSQRPELKKKSSNWKSIRDLFGRKPSKTEVPEPFYKLKVPEAQSADRPTAYSASPPPVAKGDTVRSRIHQRTPSMTRGMARLEARTQHESVEMFSPSAHERTDSPLSTTEKIDPMRTPQLNLDLPSLGFDRYSVMFEKLLEEPKPSILERRQSKLPRKKSLKILESTRSISEQSVIAEQPTAPAVPQRSLTSPSLLKSRLSVKVSKKDRAEDEKTAAFHRPQPIQRSRTAPPGAQSPRTAAFIKANRLGPTPTSATFSQISENSLPPTPNTANTTVSDKDSVAIISNAKKASAPAPTAEPSWDMLTSLPARTQSYRQQQQQREPYLRVKSPEDLEKQMVQVSVARQVSVTKARRTVQHAVVTKQPLKPRVVVMGGREKERKSTVVLIESGDD
ncbi:uncharacterized protein LTR77_005452 [Saxophila tyrrhenica]|uniref:Uncharacterized protein n=1 Tax=Saxophila tyrrhenica TaxID=1690608 RepID=A0AAV9PAQ4_9PEZI|nr:hypothetical protein LTR77_005452 [Saxophila tyrrhenica]